MDRSALGFTRAYEEPATCAYPLGNGYRWYLPALMRFNAPDGLSPFGAGGVNGYSYCLGDPINRGDPSGHIPMDEFGNLARSASGSGEDAAAEAGRAETHEPATGARANNPGAASRAGDGPSPAREAAPLTRTGRGHPLAFSLDITLDRRAAVGYRSMTLHSYSLGIEGGPFVPFDRPRTLWPGQTISTPVFHTGNFVARMGLTQTHFLDLLFDLNSDIAEPFEPGQLHLRLGIDTAARFPPGVAAVPGLVAPRHFPEDDPWRYEANVGSATAVDGPRGYAPGIALQGAYRDWAARAVPMDPYDASSRPTLAITIDRLLPVTHGSMGRANLVKMILLGRRG